MDAALVVSIIAVVFAGLAAAFAGWSAFASHRSARSAESSAASAATAVELERDRRHRELTPRIELAHDGAIGGLGEQEAISFTSHGPLPYTSVEFLLMQDSTDRPIAGLLIDGQVAQIGSIGELDIGERLLVPLRRPGPGKGSGTLHLRITCRNDQGTWTIPAQVEIPGVPFVGFA